MEHRANSENEPYQPLADSQKPAVGEKQHNARAAGDEDPPIPASTLNSIIVLAVVGLVDAIEYGMVMPSLSKYLEQIQGHSDTKAYGLVLALFSCASLCCKPVVGRWCDMRSFREVYVVTITLAICGAAIYALARWQGSLAMVFIGRMLGGCGAANTSLLYAYVSRTVPPAKQTMVMMATGLTFPIGMALGPCTNLITASADFSIGGVKFDDTNSPGALLALILILLLAAVVCLLVEPPPYAEKESDGPSKDVSVLRGVWQEVRRPAVAVCFVVIFDFNMFLTASESVVVPVTQHASKLHFIPLQNSYVYAGVAVWIMLVSISIMVLGKGVPDRWLVLVAVLGYSTSCVCVLFLWDYNMELWQFLLGEAALVTCLPLSFSPNRAIFSKLVKHSRHQALLSSILSIVASLGSIAGPTWMGMTAGTPKEQGPVAHTMFFGILSLASLLLVLVVSVWFYVWRSDLDLVNDPADNNEAKVIPNVVDDAEATSDAAPENPANDPSSFQENLLSKKPLDN